MKQRCGWEHLRQLKFTVRINGYSTNHRSPLDLERFETGAGNNVNLPRCCIICQNQKKKNLIILENKYSCTMLQANCVHWISFQTFVHKTACLKWGCLQNLNTAVQICACDIKDFCTMATENSQFWLAGGCRLTFSYRTALTPYGRRASPLCCSLQPQTPTENCNWNESKPKTRIG